MPAERASEPLFTCRRCDGGITADQYRFGSDESGWEHMPEGCIEPLADSVPRPPRTKAEIRDAFLDALADYFYDECDAEDVQPFAQQWRESRRGK